MEVGLDVDSHIEIAEFPTKEKIRNAILNPPTLVRADIDDVEEENSERPPSNKEIVSGKQPAPCR